VSLEELLLTLFTFNVLTFGAGSVMIPLLQARLVDDRKVLTDDQLLYAFTIARITPGQANLYIAAIGYMLYGVVGAVLCILVIGLPSYLILPLLRGYEVIQTTRVVRGLTRGLVAASVGLILAATAEIGQRTLTNPIAWIIFPFSLVLVTVLRWHPIPSLVAASVAGILLTFVVH
jgi:chromate transporter